LKKKQQFFHSLHKKKMKSGNKLFEELRCLLGPAEVLPESRWMFIQQQLMGCRARGHSAWFRRPLHAKHREPSPFDEARALVLEQVGKHQRSLPNFKGWKSVWQLRRLNETPLFILDYSNDLEFSLWLNLALHDTSVTHVTANEGRHLTSVLTCAKRNLRYQLKQHLDFLLPSVLISCVFDYANVSVSLH
jgi:hypothetical protein